MSVQGLKRLQVWVKAKDFGIRVYKKVLPLLPADERWNLAQQLRRSSLSISANIAEGYGRFYYQDNVRFCYVARGSLAETLSHKIQNLTLPSLSKTPQPTTLLSSHLLSILS